MNQDPHGIGTVEALRAIIGEVDPAVNLKLESAIGAHARPFIALSPFLVLSTSDSEGRQDVSPKGDAPGFVEVEDDHTLLILDRHGNNLIFGLHNVLTNPHVGVLFVIPGTGETLRINGSAELTAAPAILERLCARGQPAVLAIRVRVEECFFHCAKALIRAQVWKLAAWPTMERISFGKMFAEKTGGDEHLVQAVDAMIDEDYKTGL